MKYLPQFNAMKYLLIPLLLCGCSGVLKHLKDDPATMDAVIPTPYGNTRIFRTQLQTNQTLTRTPDGTIRIESK